jgi:hypothetical protein
LQNKVEAIKSRPQIARHGSNRAKVTSEARFEDLASGHGNLLGYPVSMILYLMPRTIRQYKKSFNLWIFGVDLHPDSVV